MKKRDVLLKAVKTMPHGVKAQLQNSFIYDPAKEDKGITETKVPVFETVFFEVRTRCNGRCSFCSASIGNDTRPDEKMTPELHEKILRELAEIGYTGRIAYHNNSDPLLFKDLIPYVKKAREIVPEAYIQILTNGRALTYAKADGLLEAGINELSINFYNDNFDMDLPELYHTVISEIIPKYHKMENVKIVGIGEAQDVESPSFFFRVTRRRATEILTSRAGSAPNKQVPISEPRGFCYYPWTQFIITANGNVAQCCCDINFTNVVGNVKDNHIMDVWQGQGLAEIRKKLYNNDRSSTLCEQCDFYGVKTAPKSRMGRLVFDATQ